MPRRHCAAPCHSGKVLLEGLLAERHCIPLHRVPSEWFAEGKAQYDQDTNKRATKFWSCADINAELRSENRPALQVSGRACNVTGLRGVLSFTSWLQNVHFQTNFRGFVAVSDLFCWTEPCEVRKTRYYSTTDAVQTLPFQRPNQYFQIVKGYFC